MKLAIFGGTGRTGQHLVRQAIKAGYQVAALARNPEKFDTFSRFQNDPLMVIEGNITDPVCLDQVIRGAGAVISVLGPTSNEPTFEVSQGMELILAAMKQHGVKRIIISAGAGVGDPEDSPKLFNRLMNVLLKATAKNVYMDMLKTVDLVRSSGLEWTVVRAPMLTDDPKLGHVKVGMVGKGMGARISRADMADFILQQVNSSEQIGKAPAISN